MNHEGDIEMDIQIVKTENGKNFNAQGEEVIPCIICNQGTTMTGTEQCDRCYELDSRIRDNLDIAERLVNYYKAGGS